MLPVGQFKAVKESSMDKGVWWRMLDNAVIQLKIFQFCLIINPELLKTGKIYVILFLKSAKWQQ
jgi:hypothetical protein